MTELTTRDEASVADWVTVPSGARRTTTFLAAPRESRSPQCFLVENTPNRHLPTHFHDTDQFQVIVQGDGTLGRHPISTFTVHYARAFTPYGPIDGGAEGVSWLTLRVERDWGGSWFVSKHKDKLLQVGSRKPWQVSEHVDFDAMPQDGTFRWLGDFQDGRGLGACAIRVRPGAVQTLPAPTGTGGQFVIVARGSSIRDGREKKGLASAFLMPEDEAMTVTAGPEGLDVLVLNFPLRDPRDDRSREEFYATDTPAPAAAPEPAPAAAAASAQLWACATCGFHYDEHEGLPDEGIAPGTRWADVPADWVCPDCQAGKSDFEPVEF